MTKDELRMDPEHYAQVNKWLARGDGIAVYENMDMGTERTGHRTYLSFGGPDAQFQGEPPVRLPDFPGQINWQYRLAGTYKGEALV
jgi:hypothetical protein